MKVTGGAAPTLPQLAQVEETVALEARPSDAYVRGVDARLGEVPAEPMANFNGMVHWTPQYAFRPRTIDELSRVLRYVHDRLPPGTQVKAGGSRHSMNAAATTGVYIHPEGLKFIQRVADGRYRVGSGTTVRELNTQLWAEGRALPVMGGYDGQTLGGVMPTGTHGSVLTYGPMNSLICSIDLVKADGSKVRIEPAGGMSKEAPDGMTLIQDDAVFAAARTNVGTFGVVHSYVLDTVPKFWLLEKRVETTMDAVKDMLKDEGVYRMVESDVPSNDPRTYHMEIAFNPHSGKAVVTTRDKVELAEEPVDFTERPGRDICYTARLDKKYARPVLGTWFQEHFNKLIGFITDATTKLFPSRVSALSDASLNVLEDRAYLQRSYNVFHLGDGAQKIPVRFGTLFVPLKDDKYLRAIDVLSQAAKDWAKAHRQYQSGPISIRFVKGTDSPLGSAEDVASFEIIWAGHPEYCEEMYTHYRRALEAELGDEVRFHFGQMLSDVDAQEMKRYPKLAEWKRIRKAFDPRGVFLNDHQRSLGLGG